MRYFQNIARGERLNHEKTFAIALSLLLVLGLAACSTPDATTNPLTVPTNSLPTVPNNAAAPVQTVPATTAVHDHSYTLDKVNEPTCEDQGEMRYVCQCGERYVEYMDAIGHNWSEWAETLTLTMTEKGEAQQMCYTCGQIQTAELDVLDMETVLSAYVDLLIGLPTFQSPDELSGGLLFDWVRIHVGAVSSDWNENTYLVTNVYSLDAFDEFTTDYLGRTYDYTYLTQHNEDMTLDEENNCLIWVTGGAGGGNYMMMDSYTMIDDTHCTLRYAACDYETEAPVYYGTLQLKLVDGRFMIESHTKER